MYDLLSNSLRNLAVTVLPKTLEKTPIRSDSPEVSNKPTAPEVSCDH